MRLHLTAHKRARRHHSAIKNYFIRFCARVCLCVCVCWFGISRDFIKNKKQNIMFQVFISQMSVFMGVILVNEPRANTTTLYCRKMLIIATNGTILTDKSFNFLDLKNKNIKRTFTSETYVPI